MPKTNKQKKNRRKIILPEPGLTPGFIYIDANALKPKIRLYSYSAESYKVDELNDLKTIKKLTSDQKLNYWVEVKGFNSKTMFELLNTEFDINKLVLEDITRTYQRPKFEEYDGYNFAVSRMLYLTDDCEVNNEQISFILCKNILFTFQDVYDDCLGAVRKRLDVGKGTIRVGGSSYLMYALMDIVIDDYFSIMGKFAEQLDDIEDSLMEKADKSVMFETQKIKRHLITLRRVAWPERDKLNDILRTENTFVTEETKLYYRDAYDHCVQIIDMVESLKEIATSNIDMYLSIISNRMNEIMKVLTIISSIFIPLTFIAGIYGMNFSREDPQTGKFMPQNMPELYQEHGYIYTMLIMGVIAVLQVIYFWRKGWFK